MDTAEMKRLMIEAHTSWFQQYRLEGWEVHYINITFAHSLVPASECFAMMRMAVEDQMYPSMRRRLERHARGSRHLIWPRLFLWGDLPVFKKSGSRSRRVVNGGMHLNGFLMISPHHQWVLDHRNESIEDVLRKNAAIHKAAKIVHIHLEEVQDDCCRVTDYAMKTVTRGRLDDDHTIVLPGPWRSRSRPRPEDPSERAIKDIQSAYNVSGSLAEEIATARAWQEANDRDVSRRR